MGSIVDKILEFAPDMGVFTTRQMAFRAYGELSYKNINSTAGKLRTLAKQGYIVQVGTIVENGTRMASWRAL